MIRPLIVLLLVLLICLVTKMCARVQPGADVHYGELAPAGETLDQGGIYDPSVKYDATGKTGWLVYSAIHKSPKYGSLPVGPYIETHLAKSTDGGKSWRFVKAVNHSGDDTIHLYNGETMTGVWRYEVPSLVFDPDDRGREWKLFAHHYFWTQRLDRMPAYGWITCSCAADPAGDWSAEVPLFGAGDFPPAPYNRTEVNVDAMDPALKGMVAYSNPSALSFNGRLYLTLTALGNSGPERIILLASDYHGATWNFVATLAANKDAELLGYRKLDGSRLVRKGNRVFLFASPEVRAGMDDGPLVVEFSDLSRGELRRDAAGRLMVTKQVPAQASLMTRIGAGQSDYDEHNTYGGIIICQPDFRQAPHLFQIFNTRMTIW